MELLLIFLKNAKNVSFLNYDQGSSVKKKELHSNVHHFF